MAYATCDVQMLRGPDGRQVVKEFAVYVINLQNDEYSVFNFAPPCPESEIPPEIQTTNNYVAKYIHGLHWDSGATPYTSLEETLLKMTTYVQILYVKGEEKKKILQALIPHVQMVNIENLGCPALKHLPQMWAPCTFEPHVNNVKITCAVKNAKKIGLWLQFHMAYIQRKYKQ